MENLLSGILHGLGQGFLGSDASILVVLVFGGLGFLILVNHLKHPPFDVTRHLERPPLENKPARPLPPARDYVQWEKQQDADKEGVPWS